MHKGPITIFYEQRGAATLAVGLSLLTAITLLSLIFAHTQATDQTMTRNTLRGSEAFQAADAGLEFGRAWLSRHRPTWINAKLPLQVSAPDLPVPVIKDNREIPFAINVAFQRSLEHAHYFLVRSDAQPAGHPGLLATVQAYVRPQTVLSENGESAPPLVVGGCIASVTGIPDIYPVHAHSPGTGAAIASAGDESCLNINSIDMHGGHITEKAFPPGQAWRYMFRVSKTEMQALSDTEAEAGIPAGKRRYWWASKADLSGNQWRRSLGSPDNPVVLVLPKELSCPRLGAGTSVYGVVYIEGRCNDTNRWGTSHIYGNLVVEGSLGLFNQELRLAHINHGYGNPEEMKLPLIDAPMVPGTWKDF